MFSKVLVPWDGTPSSAAALTPARTIARATGAAMELMRVVSPQGIPRLDDEAIAEANESLGRVMTELQAVGLRVSSSVRVGEPAHEILDEAHRADVDLIAMVTHGRHGLGRVLLGSVAEQVLSHTTTPLLLLRAGGHRTDALRTLLVPVDGTPGGCTALASAVELARTSGARLMLVEVVVPSMAYVWSCQGYGFIPGEAFEPETDEAALRNAKGYVAELAEDIRRGGIQVVPHATVGPIVGSIEAVADQVDADLIVMSSHARTGPARALLGSVADTIVRESHRPVLVVRRNVPNGALHPL